MMIIVTHDSKFYSNHTIKLTQAVNYTEYKHMKKGNFITYEKFYYNIPHKNIHSFSYKLILLILKQ